MNQVQEMITQFEKEGCRVELHKSYVHIICWLWRADRIVSVGVGRSEIDALKRARKCLDEGKLLPSS